MLNVLPADGRQNGAASLMDNQIHLPNLATPRLLNGELNICALNSSFVVFLRAHPDIASLLRRERLRGIGDDSLMYQIQEILGSRELRGTNLLGVKRYLSQHYPHAPAYQAEERGGYALEAFQHMVCHFVQETGTHDRWRHCRIVTEDRGHPPTCCGQILHYQSTEKMDAIIITATNTEYGVTSLQSVVDRFEKKKRQKVVEATCPTCNEKQPIQAVSLPEKMPAFFTVEWSPYATTLTDVTLEISWGGAVFKPCGIIHHGDGHFWASVKEPDDEQTWWMLEDFCGLDAVATWRRRYGEGPRGQETSPEGGLVVHKLKEKIGLILLEKKDAAESVDGQV